MKDLEAKDREEITNILMFFEGKAETYYRAMNDKKLDAYYKEYLKKGEAITTD